MGSDGGSAKLTTTSDASVPFGSSDVKLEDFELELSGSIFRFRVAFERSRGARATRCDLPKSKGFYTGVTFVGGSRNDGKVAERGI